jgi:hypothetical protein
MIAASRRLLELLQPTVRLQQGSNNRSNTSSSSSSSSLLQVTSSSTTRLQLPDQDAAV